MADIFDVVADPTRRDLLQVLLERYMASESDPAAPGAGASGGAISGGAISVGEIVEKMGLSQPTVSKHLKVLRDHGLVHVREEGQHRYYSLDSSPLEDLEDWLIPFLSADFDDADAAGSTVFAAWSGVQVPAPLRRAAESLQHPGDAGAAIGRVAADASFQAINAIQDASHGVERRVISPIKKKLGRKDG